MIEPNDFVSIHTTIESRDPLFDEKQFSSIPRPSSQLRNINQGTHNDLHIVPLNTYNDHSKEASEDPEPEPNRESHVGPPPSEDDEEEEPPTARPDEETEPKSLPLRRSTRVRKHRDPLSHFVVYLVEGSGDKEDTQHPVCFNVDQDPQSFDEAMKSRDAPFWKEAIDDEMDSFVRNGTWLLTDLPPGCKPLGCRWIFKRMMKYDGTIDKFKARLVVQGFRQKAGIDYFDTYAPVARITTIRLLIALAAIHNLV